MVYDAASFDPVAVQKVYPPGLRKCFLGSVSQVYDKNHILGRCPPKGYTRDVMSSVFNLGWLGREVHSGPARDDYRIRSYQLERAYECVQDAVRRGDYELTENDVLFLGLVQKWEAGEIPGWR